MQTPEQHRSEDAPLLTIMRAVPMTWLLGIVGAMLLWAASQFFGQQALAEKLTIMTAKFEALSASVNSGNAKVQEHEFKLADHERRLQALERKP